MDVQGRSVALLMEDGVRDAAREPQHTSIPVIEVELHHDDSDTTESASEAQQETEQESTSEAGHESEAT
jgi:hypothetical protein